MRWTKSSCKPVWPSINMLLPRRHVRCVRGGAHQHKNMTIVDRCGEPGQQLAAASKLAAGNTAQIPHTHIHTRAHTHTVLQQKWALLQAVAKRWRMQPGGSGVDETGPIDSTVSPRRPCKARHLANEYSSQFNRGYCKLTCSLSTTCIISEIKELRPNVRCMRRGDCGSGDALH